MSNVSISELSKNRIRRVMETAGVSECDLDEKFIAGGGSGGQKINKTASCVHLLHAPSGTVVKCQKSRSRELNRWLARRILAERLLEKIRSENSARLRAAEKIRRAKRRRSRRQKQKMLDEKSAHGRKKELRRPPTDLS